MECDRLRDDRLDVLYGEADASTRRRVEEHLASCGACREELTGLKRLRQDLRAWTLPESRGPAFVAPRRASLWLPLAAGFLLALGVGLGWSGAELRYDDRGLGVRLGRPQPRAGLAAGLPCLDGKNGQHVARTTELMGYVLDAAHPR